MIRSSLKAETRERKGKQAAKQSRSGGMIPAVLYGPGKEPRKLVLDPKDLLKAISTKAGENTLIDLTVGTEAARVVLLRELQVDPITRNYLHADLYEVPMDKKIKVTIPIKVVGEPVGVKEGGILDQIIREIEAHCLPTEIPDLVTVDVSALKIGNAVHVRDLTLPPGIEIGMEADLTVATVTAPRAEEVPVAAAAAEGAPAEPELVGKEKKEGEEEAEGEEKAEKGEKKAEKAEKKPEKGEKKPEKKEKGDKK